MKDLMRQNLGINIEVMDLLNKQMVMEAEAADSYLAMASWCDQNALNHSAELLYDQSEEEREHQMKIFKYINDNGGAAKTPKVGKILEDFNSLKEIYETALDQEIEVTKSIHAIVKKCREVEDYRTEVFLHWFIQEQMEEEIKMRNILDLFELMKDSPIALKLIDERVKDA
ncbi:MAG TPA: ferritin [Flavobacteriaceae bacterium]|nr:ferritin [Flavobacteriaceae bacterium]